MQEFGSHDRQSNRLRLNTLIRLRWLAIVGQSVTVLIVAYWLEFPLPVGLAFGLIACSAWLNLFLALRYPAAYRLRPFAALCILVFDALQLAGLLFITGGLTNPFSLLMTVPVVISATSLPLQPRSAVARSVSWSGISILRVFFWVMPGRWRSDFSRLR